MTIEVVAHPELVEGPSARALQVFNGLPADVEAGSPVSPESPGNVIRRPLHLRIDEHLLGVADL
ncbi:MAG: hypothetical protein MI806_17545, partial [Minwuiales bacterium]|nr:hypothetical protein [Minwuiales bacterium]